MAKDLFRTGEVMEDEKKARSLLDFMTKMDATIRLDWTRRVHGDGVYVGYKTLREFYKGKQWSYKKEGNGTMRTYNYCFTIVENMTAFLTNEPPQISCAPSDITNPVERILAEGRTKLLKRIHDTNKLSLQFQKGARTGSLTGDTFIFGPYPEFEVKEDKADLDKEGKPNQKKELTRISYWNVENPENIRPIWKDENFNEMYGFIKQYRVSVEVIKRMFKSELADTGINIVPDKVGDMVGENDGVGWKTEVPMCTVKELWTENEYILVLNNGKDILKYIQHDWGFLPIQWIPNIHLPGEPKGTSDLENELDPQQEYN